MKIEWQKCPCGHPACRYWQPVGLGSFHQGTGFTTEERDEIDRAFDAERGMRDLLLIIRQDLTVAINDCRVLYALEPERKHLQVRADYIARRIAQIDAVLAPPRDETPMPRSDVNNLDEVVHELGIEDSETTPAEAVRELKAEIERRDETIRDLLAERDALAAENERLKEDRARFPDKPDDIGRMIEAHIGNLKEGKKSAEALADKAFDRAFRAEAALAARRALTGGKEE